MNICALLLNLFSLRSTGCLALLSLVIPDSQYSIFVELILYCERFQIKIVVVVDNTDSAVNKGHNVYVVVCRDRVSALWSTVRDHLSNILVNAAQHRYELNNN